MDDARFDALARALTAARSRRGLLGAALAGLLVRATAEDAAACARPGAPCDPRRPGKCCSKRCSAKKKTCLCAKPADCPKGACQRATCSAAGRCGTRDLAPGTPCGDGKACDSAGRCAPTCGEGSAVDLLTDPRHCGACGAACPLNEICDGGVCTCGDMGKTAAPSTCCRTSHIWSYCVNADESFLAADTCAIEFGCENGYTVCIGACRACCPPGTTCDLDDGVCRQA